MIMKLSETTTKESHLNHFGYSAIFFILGVDKISHLCYNRIDSVSGPGGREVCENFHKQKFFLRACEKNNLLNFPKMCWQIRRPVVL